MSYDVLVRKPRGSRGFAPVLTQGAIITGVSVPRYPSALNGLLITARCDFAQEKAAILNALPIVPLDRWLRLDGVIHVLLRRVDVIREKFEDTLDRIDKGIFPAIRNLDWHQAFSTFVEPNDSYRRDLVSQAKALLTELANFQTVLSTRTVDDAGMTAELRSNRPLAELVRQKQETLIQNLLTHKIADAHFLPAISLDERLDGKAGWVVLFRNLMAIPGSYAQLIEDGLDGETVRATAAADPAFSRHFRPDADVVGLLANLASPHVEHVLQRFGGLFTRIGVEDCTESYLSTVIANAAQEFLR